MNPYFLNAYWSLIVDSEAVTPRFDNLCSDVVAYYADTVAYLTQWYQSALPVCHMDWSLNMCTECDSFMNHASWMMIVVAVGETRSTAKS